MVYLRMVILHQSGLTNSNFFDVTNAITTKWNCDLLYTYLHFNSHLPDKPALLGFLFPSVLENTFGKVFLPAEPVWPSCQSTNSVEALREHKALTHTSGLVSSFTRLPLNSWQKRHHSLYASSLILVSDAMQIPTVLTSVITHTVPLPIHSLLRTLVHHN